MFVRVPAPAMLATLLVAGLAALSAARAAPPPGKPYYDLNNAPNIYKAFVKQHSKVYNADEYNKRFKIFKDSLRMVNELNEKYNYTTFDIYHFADLTEEELRSYTGFDYSARDASAPAPAPAPELRGVTAPPAFDWRDQHVVSPIKDQGGCRSCYAFSAIGNIESQYAIKHKQCLSLSEQQVLDCTDTGGCEGGYMSIVMQYVQRLRRRRAELNGGEPALARDEAACMKESDYPYLGYVDKKCHETKNKQVVTVLKGEEIHIPDEDYLLKLLYTYGPLSVALNSFDLFKYQGGILSPTSCDPNALDHGVLLVGYGEEKGMKFWIIKNSWGPKFGEEGYVRLERGITACGIATNYTAKAEVA